MKSSLVILLIAILFALPFSTAIAQEGADESHRPTKQIFLQGDNCDSKAQLESETNSIAPGELFSGPPCGYWHNYMRECKNAQTHQQLNDLRYIIGRRFGVRTAPDPDNAHELSVVGVEPGSEGYYLGMNPGDHIDSLVIFMEKLIIEYRHGGKHGRYELEMIPIDQCGIGGPRSNRTQTKFKRSKPTISVVLESSHAMSERDCPQHTSRWKWSCQQIDKFDPNSFVYTCGSSCRHWAGVSSLMQRKPDSVLQADLSTGLRAGFGEYIGARRNGISGPWIIVIISGGPKRQVSSLQTELQHITSRLKNENDIRIVFLQVGDDNESSAYIGHHKDREYNSDVVRYKSFDEFKRLGLRGIVDQAATEIRNGK